jgi:DNA-binding NarL/FixJ family response regulator
MNAVGAGGADPVWVDVRTTQAVVAYGLEAMLRHAGDRLALTLSGPPERQPDVVIYDVIQLADGNGADLDHLLRHSLSTVIALDRSLKPELGTRARDKGVEWAISLDITPEELVQVIEDAVSGSLEDDTNVATEWLAEDYLGKPAGLSPRESQLLQLVVLGHSNQEIADELYLSINSVKTYIRTTYRKLGVVSRGQAILWAVLNGFLTERTESDEDDRASGAQLRPPG